MIPVSLCLSGRELFEPDPSPDGEWVLIGTRVAGRTGFILVPAAGGPERLVVADPPPSVAHGHGGGCTEWLADSSGWLYLATDGQIWLHLLTGEQHCLTAFDPTSDVGSPTLSPDGRWLAVVVDLAEIHVFPAHLGPDPAPAPPAPATVVHRAAPDWDFVLDPVWAPTLRDDPNGASELVWQAWRVPAMPWDASYLVAPTGIVAGLGTGQAQQPRFGPAGELFCVRDDEGFANIHRHDTPVVSEPFEHAEPTWGPRQRSFAVSPDGTRLAYHRNEGGFGRLVVVDLATGSHRDVARGVHAQLRWVGGRLTALRSGARTPSQAVSYDTESWERTVLAVGPVAEWLTHDHELVEPDLVTATTVDGETIPARLYRPLRRTDIEESSRLICWVHGGPTDQWAITFRPRIAYWVSRGWHVLVPDHRGSTGHGRAFQQALNGRWGDADTDDVAAAIRHVQSIDAIRPTRTVMMGGSAGGYVALRVAERYPELIAGAAVVYPVSDPTSLFEATHRFEAHYDHSLVGPGTRPVDPQRITRPVLILHGDADPVVPFDQSVRFAERVRSSGGDVELHIYEGEGHGFRQPESQRDEFARISTFVSRIVPDSDPG